MIIVWAETDGDGLAETTREAMTFARDQLAVPDESVEAMVIGDEVVDPLRRELGDLGAAALLHAEDDRLAAYGGAAWATALTSAARTRGARAVVAAGTPRGSELMAHVATRLDAAMAANVVSVDSTEPLHVSRQVLGGSVLEEVELGGDVAVLTVAGHACEPENASTATEPEVISVSVELSEHDLLGRVVRVEETESEDTSALTKAKVVVGAGRGVGRADGFDDLLELTELLGGALGVSRVVTNLGWRPHHEQVGQTGSRISPDLYLACGISGAIQHWAGCQSAKTIIAINTDPDAPMVTRADYAVIGDLHEVVPALTEELRRRRG
ncbi:MAG TPA: electron transfer flavoprotein subunit alpha/FixB family protein [Segeticoccus sp.]|uniref:electron transfer flavoprotein subunit alpha/FixB family protein n=1 Tax=Segeticoccus sp. TaxID=2706531 RepID=UPI002D80AD65|nr:electron transfer flavoprotein subunit alpha/FixB family protein [Segeticoccus sp.]HET8599474.1 electron transfer flavoprotein subunit alpha/FixB family protein [Segeticoccus sp.]